ncbi:hypothetical protein E2320_003035, partial [Naja naja]
MAERNEENQTEIKEFHLMGFVGLGDLQVLLFCLFLAIYIATMVGNIFNSGAFVQSVDIQSTKQYELHNDECLHIAQNRWIVRHQQSLVSVLYNPDFFYTTYKKG